MDGTGFLKTVSFGGFDKKDVLAYVDKLNTQIYTLENELNEAKKLADASGADGDTKAKYEELLKADRAKIAELQTGMDSAKNQIQVAQDEVKEKDKEIEELKARLATMEDELVEAKNKAAAASTAENNAMDLSNVFMEAQRSANSIVTSAKENARKMDEDAKKLANQVVDDANSKASTIVKNADEKALRIVTEAESRSAELTTANENMKAVVLADVEELQEAINSVKSILDEFTKSGLAKVFQTSQLLADTEKTLKKNGVPQFTAPKSAQVRLPAAPAAQPRQVAQPAQPRQAAQQPAAQPAQSAAPTAQPAAQPAQPAAPAAKPAAAQPAPRPQPQPSAPKKIFDIGDLDALTKSIEASAKAAQQASAKNAAAKPAAPAPAAAPADDYDSNSSIDPKSVKLSRM